MLACAYASVLVELRSIVSFIYCLKFQVQLSDAQKKYYRAILEKNFTHLCKVGK